MVALCLGLVNQTHISSGSSHESLWSCSKWVALIRRETNSSYLHVSDKNFWTCNSHAASSSSKQVLARSNAQRKRHRCCIFTAHARKSPAVHWIFHRIVSVPKHISVVVVVVMSGFDLCWTQLVTSLSAIAQGFFERSKPGLNAE